MKRSVFALVAGSLALGLAACVEGVDEPTPFSSYDGEVQARTHEVFDLSEDKFTFAVFSDLTGGERERVFEIAVAQLNLLRPELIMNVGDLIEGDSNDEAGLAAEWDSFDKRAQTASAPVVYTGGNHDLTGEMLRRVWEQRYGPRYFHFVYKNVLFIVLDTEDNTPERMAQMFAARRAALEVWKTEGPDAFPQTEYWSMPERTSGTIGKEQSDYIVDAIEQNLDVRWTFLFMHKPAWTNLEDENFSAIETALTDRPYTVFNGHNHAYVYLERHGRDYVQLATTGGSQFLGDARSMDQIALVTVDDDGVHIANLLLSGILDKTGKIPLDGDDVCFEMAKCGESP